MSKPKTTIPFCINHKKYGYLLDNEGLKTENKHLVPNKITDICQKYLKEGPSVTLLDDITCPWVNENAFQLFMNCILTPLDEKVYNPQKLCTTDLIPIFNKFTYKNEDDLKIKELIEKRLVSQSSWFGY